MAELDISSHDSSFDGYSSDDGYGEFGMNPMPYRFEPKRKMHSELSNEMDDMPMERRRRP